MPVVSGTTERDYFKKSAEFKQPRHTLFPQRGSAHHGTAGGECKKIRTDCSCGVVFWEYVVYICHKPLLH
jgi:hypothetical protein